MVDIRVPFIDKGDTSPRLQKGLIYHVGGSRLIDTVHAQSAVLKTHARRVHKRACVSTFYSTHVLASSTVHVLASSTVHVLASSTVHMC